MDPSGNKLLRLCPECGSEKIKDAGPRHGKPPGQVFACPECGYEGTSVTEGDEVTARALEEIEEEMGDWARAQLKKLCSQCGSDDLIDDFWRHSGWRHRCRNCNYVGHAVEGDEEMAQALRAQWETQEKKR